ncbi:4-hydroxy-tetrahydrodipicolinate synthase [Ferrimicrobium sp.]|nr:4-hydroxy-tetrahydrodipicolinate synthase [Ferrimicrobium sp.]
MTPMFGAVVTAMGTPFMADGRIDEDGVVALARWLVANGSDALVVTGSTGESGTLSDAERRLLWLLVREAVDCPVLAGATTNDTAHSLRLIDDAEEVGADGILAVTPYYNRPPQAGLIRHFSTIAAATELPVMLYDIPARTGRRIELPTFLALMERHANIVAVKDASGDVARLAKLAAALEGRAQVYCGDDALLLPFLSLGAVGIVSVASHWAGVGLQALIDAALHGDLERAARLNRVLIPSYDFESSELYPNPIPTKAMMAELGVCQGFTRSPLIDPPEELRKEAVKLYAQLRMALANEGVELIHE